jgi:hypothetical protein
MNFTGVRKANPGGQKSKVGGQKNKGPEFFSWIVGLKFGAVPPAWWKREKTPLPRPATATGATATRGSDSFPDSFSQPSSVRWVRSVRRRRPGDRQSVFVDAVDAVPTTCSTQLVEMR